VWLVALRSRLKVQPQDHYIVWENIVHIQAASEEQAYEKAKLRALEDEADGQFLNNQPSEWVFAGVRMLCECVDSDQRPGDGTEVSFLELEFDSKEGLEKFVGGKSGMAQFIQRFRNVEDDEE